MAVEVSKTPKINAHKNKVFESDRVVPVCRQPLQVGTRHALDDWSNTYIGLSGTFAGYGRLKYAEFDPYGKQSNFTSVRTSFFFCTRGFCGTFAHAPVHATVGAGLDASTVPVTWCKP